MKKVPALTTSIHQCTRILASAVKQEKENKHLIWKKSIKLCHGTYMIICVDNPMEGIKNALEQVVVFSDVVEYKVSLLESFSFYLLPKNIW